MRGHLDEEKIALLAGDDLAAGEMPAATDHVAWCPSCSAMVESYRQKRQVMAAFRDTGIETGEFADIRQSVLECLPRARSGQFRIFSLPKVTPVRCRVLAAMLLAAVAIGAYIWKQTQPVEIIAWTKISTGKSVPPSNGLIVEPVSAQTATQRPGRQAQKERRGTALSGAPVFGETDLDPKTESHQAALPDDVAIKLETSDPNIIIIWLKSPMGAER